MDCLKYLARIGCEAPAPATLPTLRALQAAHLRHVPFENLDIHLGRPITLAGSYAKIVEAGRGGFCYELNSAFAELLRRLGFAVELVSARVYNAQSGYGPEFDHLALLVAVDGQRYLADVGFGDFAFAPLLLEPGLVQADPAGQFRLVRPDAQHLAVEKFDGAAFVPQYIFSEKARVLSEFEAMCHYHQTSPASHFTQKRVCSRPTATGRVTITGSRLLLTEGGTTTETTLADEAAFRQALRQHFGMELEGCAY